MRPVALARGHHLGAALVIVTRGFYSGTYPRGLQEASTLLEVCRVVYEWVHMPLVLYHYLGMYGFKSDYYCCLGKTFLVAVVYELLHNGTIHC